MTVIPCYNNARGSKGNVCSLPNRVYFKSSKKSFGFLEFFLDVSDFSEFCRLKPQEKSLDFFGLFLTFADEATPSGRRRPLHRL
jgi:hypothetical protein